MHRNATLKKELEESKKQLLETKQELATMQADKDEPIGQVGCSGIELPNVA